MKRIQRISRKVNRNRQVHQQQQQPSLLASNKLGRLEMKIPREQRKQRQKKGSKEREKRKGDKKPNKEKRKMQ
jgi:hypothetical protein